MIIASLKQISNFSLYMSLVSIVLFLITFENNLIVTLPVFVSSIILTTYLTQKGNLKYLGLIPLVFNIFLININLGSIAVLIPVYVYFIGSLIKNSKQVSTYNLKRMFILFCKIFTIAVLIILFFNLVGSMTGYGSLISYLPVEFFVFSITYFFATTFLLRCLRHDQSVLDDQSFFLRNCSVLLGILLITFLLSTEFVLGMILNLIQFIWNNTVIRLFQLLAWLVLLPFRGTSIPVYTPTPEEYYHECFENCIEIYDGDLFHDVVSTTQNSWIFEVILLVLGVALAVFVLKKFIKKDIFETEVQEKLEQRISLDGPARKRLKNKRMDNQIRVVYQRFLKMLLKRKFDLPRYLTSQDIARNIDTTLNNEIASKMRDIYTKYRYSQKSYTADDLSSVKQHYRDIKKDLPV